MVVVSLMRQLCTTNADVIRHLGRMRLISLVSGPPTGPMLATPPGVEVNTEGLSDLELEALA